MLRPPPSEDAARRVLAATASLAIARAVDEFGVESRLKWPNDVLVSSHKIGGCIVDLGRDFAIIGVGINANLGHGDLPRGSEIPAASLRTLLGHAIDRERLLAATLRHLDALLRDIEDRGIEATIEAVVSRDGLRGAEVTAREGERQLRGVVERSHPLEGIDLRIDPATVVRLRPEHARLLSCRLP
jgi:BirA family biotin operon repressor/biotin-[acetyl-CoA-carboxylase] ligase